MSFIFRERGREVEREGEKHQCVVASSTPLTGDLAHNPGMCPDWELNQRPFGSQTGTQCTEPQQPGQDLRLFDMTNNRLGPSPKPPESYNSSDSEASVQFWGSPSCRAVFPYGPESSKRCSHFTRGTLRPQEQRPLQEIAVTQLFSGRGRL